MKLGPFTIGAMVGAFLIALVALAAATWAVSEYIVETGP